MAIKIRLARAGAKKRPYYKIVVADSRSPRDGKFIEKIGNYNPLLSKNDEKRITMKEDRVKFWLSSGAVPTERVVSFLNAKGIEQDNTCVKKINAKRVKVIELKKVEVEAKKKAEAEKTALEAKAKEEAEKAEAEKLAAEQKAKEEAEKAEAAEKEAAEKAKSEEKPAEAEKSEEPKA